MAGLDAHQRPLAHPAKHLPTHAVGMLVCWLRAVGEGRDTRVRIAVGPRGEELVPTAEEAERAAKEAERTAKEAERAAKEAERAAKEAALAEVKALETQLHRLRRRPRR